MPLPNGGRLGPYEILDPLGAGGMGEVYRARDTRLDRMVAVKMLPADSTSAQALERFEREAKAIASLNHPGICSIYDVGTSPVPFLVMELLDGQTLHERLLYGPLDLPVLVDTSLALAEALAAAHGKGIIHRDLKPANIFLTAHGPKILDFGLARIVETQPTVGDGITALATLTVRSPITDAGVAVGTVAYMSPEQLRGEPLDVRTDLFSLGLVLYEMATGRRAFPGTTTAVTSAAILHEQPVAPRELRPDLPPSFERAILTLLEKDRDVRTQTAAELRAELRRLTRGLGGLRGTDSRPRPVAGSDPKASGATSGAVPPAPLSSSDAQLIAGLMRRHRGKVIGLAALVVIGVFGGVYLSRPGSARQAHETATTPSVADLAVESLTTSGTAADPAISPDGRYVAYVEKGSGPDSLRVRQIATGSNMEIVKGQSGVLLGAPMVTPDGTFVDYLRRVPPQSYELWQIPFIGGASRQLLSGIGTAVAFSPDGRQMAYVREGVAGETQVVIAAPDGSSPRVLARRRDPERFWIVFFGGAGLAPAWSPDGATIAVLGGVAPARGQVVFVDTHTGSERALDFGPNLPGLGLAWLDGGTVLLNALERSSQPLQLWLVSYPQGEFRRLTNDISDHVGLSLTADGNQLVTTGSKAALSIWAGDASTDRLSQIVPRTPIKGPMGFGVRWLENDLIFPSSSNGAWALQRWNTSNGDPEIISSGSGGLPQVSGDGSSVVYWDFDIFKLCTTDPHGRNRLCLDGHAPADRITPDARQVTSVEAPESARPRVMIRPIGTGGPSREVTADHVRPGMAVVSPDGRSIAYTSFDDQSRPTVTVCDLATCSSKRSFPLGEEWTPDSGGLAYVDPRTHSDIWVQRLDGGAPRRIAHFAEDGTRIIGFAWSGDGRRLAVARYSQTDDIVLLRGLKSRAR
jgi:eukaryotic-like serine/threonine-protein kinase